MASTAELMREQAARLFALAVEARERGDDGLASLLTATASRCIDQAIEAAAAAALPSPPAQQQPAAQQQQQIQPDKDEPES